MKTDITISTLSSNPFALASEENLALKALRAIQAYTGCKAGAAIHLLKRVPIQAGLGGGSADAAAMLVGLNRFWDLRLTQEELLQIGATLGSDVPFLLQGGTARGTGRGEILTYGKSPDPHWLLLVKPKVSVSTAAAYGRFTNKSVATKQTIDTVQQHLENNDSLQKHVHRRTYHDKTVTTNTLRCV